MSSFVSTLLFLFITAAFGITPAVNQTSEATEPMCYDWGESTVAGESSVAGVRVMEGEVGWLSCPLFSHPSVYRFSSGHNLFWYRIPEGHDLEQPITYSSRLSRDRDRLWLQPAEASDTGLYICMLRNKSSCSKISIRLRVLRPADVSRRTDCEPAVAVATTPMQIPLQEDEVLDCPDLQDVANMTDGHVSVSWSYVHLQGQRCYQAPFLTSDRQQRGLSLVFHVMYDNFQGLYFCSVSYQRRGQTLNYTRSFNVTTVSPTNLPKFPSIIHPAKDQVLTVERGAEVRLLCRAQFPHLKSQWTRIWWTVDGQTPDKLTDSQRFSVTHSLEKEDHGDRTEVSELLILDFLSDDVHRDFSCSVKNERGNETRRALLEEKVELPVLELGCGLAVTLVLMLVLFVVYHVFWLELLLLYRSWFGTDERHTDDKDYDVYISYARNTEEEQFVLSTLRRVLENELGYTVCIFDRDSLPGGTITDETLGFVARSRRLLVVVSPGYACQGSQALLELQAGIDSMARGGHLRVILVQYQPVRSRGWVRELRRARLALALVRWQGDKSRELTSTFWKRLRVELPVRRVSCRDQEDPVLLRLNSKSSTDLTDAVLLSMQRSRRLLFVLSPDFLAEKSFSLLECRLGLYLQHGLRATVVSVVYRSVSKLPCAEVAQLRQAAASSVTWRGSRSEPPRSRFWLRLRLALPVRPLALGRRLIDSTSSHSDLAALALQRVQRIQSQRGRANQSRRSRRASANQSRRDRQATPTARCRGEGSQHSRTCSGCPSFVGPVEDRRAELTVETELQQMSGDVTEVRSEPVPETDPSPQADPGPSPDPAPDPDPASDPDSDSALYTCRQDNNTEKHKQQLIGSKTPEEQ